MRRRAPDRDPDVDAAASWSVIATRIGVGTFKKKILLTLKSAKTPKNKKILLKRDRIINSLFFQTQKTDFTFEENTRILFLPMFL